MPRCLRCGNDKWFSSSAVRSGLPAAGSAYGLMAGFDQSGAVSHLENNNLAWETAREMIGRPEAHFDRCHVCGSTAIQWP